MFNEVKVDQFKTGQSFVLYQASVSKKPSRLGKFLMVIGLLGLTGYLSPMLAAEANYRLSPAPSLVEAVNLSVTETSKTTAAPQNFSLAIPKIHLSTPVVANVDPYNEKEYEVSLKKGVAQAKGTAFPGQRETIYIFGHSSSFLWDNNPYGAAFYLLDKLNKDDQIVLTYNDKIYSYKVSDKKIIEGRDFSFLTLENTEKLVLQTCWPPSTNWKRLVVIADPVESMAVSDINTNSL
ncbi:hypothetical protein COT44_00345 [Candidatus Shapirobacteria bacterium CG08_land_8_20_14_0_20_39_18]|uniref:Sortase n=1 Tax=Candidatus Shapirobacteria bacterium CG08_land_8_20_14_0_20_39_18 TaxID=1974883 RepID=A0A2M6XE47_9BACT|nr:MAG: hypothetical protein COT44_00345 [Candidatus Shapirobacteria bacterium CG08_land_8_20_14_0_20_39_18]PIY64717.1 MAG: hypothetical protein COY91_04585 [Candidatus Shapirobacteria bacterium CG_4_10_14_0_8_um_filter_39_15]PJE68669.1 MAG: hypothetical protein COU94_00800 [Candidatus Shapirobacteria bacterium CG10_big_fil_rev_8_21_14_0_10_38_8]